MGQTKGIIRKIADETNLDQATVRRALAAANLTEQDCEVDFPRAVALVTDWADTDRVMGHAASGRGEGGGNSTAYTEAKAHTERLRARKLEIQNAQAEGSLVSREAVTETGARIIATVRVGLLALGYRVADKVAGKSDTTEISRIIETEVRDVLGVLADPDRFFEVLEAEALG